MLNLHKEKLKRISRWLESSKAPPFKSTIIPTNRCNLKCYFCPNALPRIDGKFKIEDELKKEEWTRFVQESLEFGVWEWSIIGGGEPFLRRETVLQIIDIIKNFNNQQICEVITNGTLLRPDDIKKLVELSLDRIIFSIDSPDAETHNYLRGVKGSYEKVIKNLKELSSVKKSLKRDRPYIKINMVLNKRNYRKVIKMVKFAKRVGASELALHPMREYFEFRHLIQHLILRPEGKKELTREIKRAKEVSESLDIFLNLDMVQLEDRNAQSTTKNKIMKTRCFEPFYAFLVDPCGNVGHCGPSGSGNPELNILKRNLRDIWYGEILNDIRKKIAKGESLKCCSKCGLTDMAERLEKEMIKFISVG